LRIALLVFAKAPVPGEAKTRLIPALGPGGAAVLSARLTRRTLRTAAAGAWTSTVLCCAPDATHEFFALCRRLHGVALRDQCGADLGERMHEAFEWALASHDAAILVGTDIPSMAPEDLAQAAGVLEGGADAVLGPAQDGGYWLIGLRRNAEALFSGVAWSTPAVAATTRQRLHGLGWRWGELPLRADLDEPEDLDALPGVPGGADLLSGLTVAPASGR